MSLSPPPCAAICLRGEALHHLIYRSIVLNFLRIFVFCSGRRTTLTSLPTPHLRRYLYTLPYTDTSPARPIPVPHNTAGLIPTRPHTYHGPQVHEKSILLPLLPITILAASEPSLALWAPLVATFSMFPLLHRDGVVTSYIATALLYLAAMWPAAEELRAAAAAAVVAVSDGGQPLAPGRAPGALSRLWNSPVLGVAALLLGLVLHAVRALVPAPERLPWLHDRVFISAAFAYFAAVAMYLQVRQWQLPAEGRAGRRKGKKA